MSDRLEQFKVSKEIQSDYVKWRNDAMTKYVIDLLKDILIADSRNMINQGISAEFCGLMERRRAGFSECIGLMSHLDDVLKVNQDMPEETYIFENSEVK